MANKQGEGSKGEGRGNQEQAGTKSGSRESRGGMAISFDRPAPPRPPSKPKKGK